MNGRYRISASAAVAFGALALSLTACSDSQLAPNLTVPEDDVTSDASEAASASRPRDIAPFISPNYTVGEIVMLDDLADTDQPACDGYIWTFNVAGTGTFSRTDGDRGLEIEGDYSFDGKTLHLTNVTQHASGEGNKTSVRDLTFPVALRRGSRLAIGSKSYRICASGGGGGAFAAEEADRPEEPEGQRGEFSCNAVEEPAAALLSKGIGRQVLELNTEKEEIVDGELKCTGTAITEAGNLTVFFGTETTPKGQRLIRATWIR